MLLSIEKEAPRPTCLIPWSDKQKDIFQEVATGTGNMIVEACAGGAKTTTILESTHYIPQGKSVLFCAFNKSIAEQLEKKLPAGAKAATLHSIAYQAMKQLGYAKVNGRKTSNILQYELVDMEDSDQKDWYFENYREIVRLISRLKGSTHTFSKEQVHNSAYELGIESSFYLDSFLYPCYTRSLEYTGKKGGCVIDYDDMLRLPLIRGCKFTIYDYVFVDEAQDLNNVQREIIQEMLYDGSKLIAVGDRKQAIYGFRGADHNSLDLIQRDFLCTPFPLDTTFRCSQAVVAEANKLYTDIYPKEGAALGSVFNISEDRVHHRTQAGDMVLCRVNYPLIAGAYREAKMGKKVCVLGKDIGDSMISFAKSVCKKYNLAAFTKDSCLRYLKEKQEDMHPGAFDRLKDTCFSTISLMDRDSSTIAHLKAAIRRLFVSEPSEDSILFSSIHKAKGLEADRVFLLRPDLLPHPKASGAVDLLQEKNLLYVAITRAKTSFIYVTEEDTTEEYWTGESVANAFQGRSND